MPDKDKFGLASASIAIDDGHLTSSAKQKIVSLLRSLIIQHTLYPTSEQYTTVCTRLVQKYPKLRDTIGNGIVSFTTHTYTVFLIIGKMLYSCQGSWKISLRNSLKNYRRDHNPQTNKRLCDDDHHQPPSKRANLIEVVFADSINPALYYTAHLLIRDRM